MQTTSSISFFIPLILMNTRKLLRVRCGLVRGREWESIRRKEEGKVWVWVWGLNF